MWESSRFKFEVLSGAGSIQDVVTIEADRGAKQGSDRDRVLARVPLVHLIDTEPVPHIMSLQVEDAEPVLHLASCICTKFPACHFT